MGQPNRQLSPPNLDLRHIQYHFRFTFPRVALTRFSGGFSLPVFEPSAGSGLFLSLSVISCPASNMGQKHRSGCFPSARAEPCPTPRCRDCTIVCRNCKSFLLKRNCRRTASFDTIQRQLTIRSDQINTCDTGVRPILKSRYIAIP